MLKRGYKDKIKHYQSRPQRAWNFKCLKYCLFLIHRNSSMEETNGRGCKQDTEAKLDRHAQTDTDNVVYGTQRQRLRHRQSFRRWGERLGSRVGIYQRSEVSPPSYSIVCRPKISVRENLSQNGPESLDLEMNLTKRWESEKIWSYTAGWVGRSTSSGVERKVGESSTDIFMPHTKEPVHCLTFLASISSDISPSCMYFQIILIPLAPSEPANP